MKEEIIQVQLCPEKCSPFHHGEFQGWGTSLCWWANRVGYSEQLTQKAVEAFFSEKGLRLNIGRYNIGGGDDPGHRHIVRSDSRVPGVWDAFRLSSDGSRVEWISYDLEKDCNQTHVALAARKANPAMILEAFSNSPPYFMTESGCVSGADPANQDNLKSTMYDDFADYLATAVHKFREKGIVFQSCEAMNEPDTDFWVKYSPKQEGCHFSSGESESRMLLALRRALDEKGLQDVIVAGMDETGIDQSLASLGKLSEAALSVLGRIDTHSYQGTKRKELKEKAVSLGKDLWMSEVDGTFLDGEGPMAASLGFAVRILEDMNGMQPAAWIIWDIIGSHRDSGFVDPNGKHGEADTPTDRPDDPLWGVAVADHDRQELCLTQKYYAFGQFTRYIRPGDTIIESTDRTLAAYNRESGEIKIVAVNTGQDEQRYGFDLSGFGHVGSFVKTVRTSGSFEEGEHWAVVAEEAMADRKCLKVTAKARSITTYLIYG